MTTSKSLIVVIIVLILIAGGFYIFYEGGLENQIKEEEIGSEEGEGGNVIENKDLWMDIELKDVRTGESFKISEFRGKPILLESFAVWCPVCKKQQEEIKKLHEEAGDNVVSISLDTDASEDENNVKEHIAKNGFDWLYAVSPSKMTQSLIDDFGVDIVSAPSAPVILICEDGSARQLGSGVKDVDELKAEIAKC